MTKIILKKGSKATIVKKEYKNCTIGDCISDRKNEKKKTRKVR